MFKTIAQIIEKQAQEVPDNIAVVCGENKITYENLNKEINKKANFLISQKITSGDYIAIIMSHSIDMIINIFAVIKSGATYVPIEPDFPKERILYILKNSGVKFIFTEDIYKNAFENNYICISNNENFSNHSSNNPIIEFDENNELYVLYTSGTTGNPKGVVVTHKNVINYIDAFKTEFKINSNDKMLQNSVCTFDIFVEELFPILATGGTLVIPNQSEKNNMTHLIKLIERESVSIISAFPYFFRELDKYKIPKSLKLAISGGDVLRKSYITNLSDKVQIYNTYGPTETTVCATYFKVDSENNNEEYISIGKPITGVKIYILDDELKQVRKGNIGEICISGNGVSKGYLNNKEETARSFINNPYEKNQKLYKTGDLGRISKNGNIEFIKRKDEQVMIEGKRVEALEVEKTLRKYDKVYEAIVKPYKDSNDYSYLVGYYKEKEKINLNELKSYLGKYLPKFMIPEFFVKLNEVPITPNGKIDRKNLPIVIK